MATTTDGDSIQKDEVISTDYELVTTFKTEYPILINRSMKPQ